MQVPSTVQLAIDAQISSFWQNSIGLGAGVTSFSAPRWNWPGFGVGAAGYRVPSYSSRGSGDVTIPSHGLHSPGSIISPSNFQPLSPATQQTPAATLFPNLRGLLQPANAATTQQSQSIAIAAPQRSMVLMRSASSKQRTLSQAWPAQSASVAPPQPSVGSMSIKTANHPNLSQASQSSQSQSHPFGSTAANAITLDDSSDDDNGGASILKVNNKEIVSLYLLLYSCMYMDV